LLKPLFISALFSWLGWGFSPGRLFFTGIAAEGICIILRIRRQDIVGHRGTARAIGHWRTLAACRRFAPKNSLPPRPDWERMVDRTTNPSRVAVGKRTNGGCEKTCNNSAKSRLAA